MNRFVSVAFFGAALLLAACSGKQTMAPKSVPPDREAQATAGEGHHHHAAAPSAAAAPDAVLAVPTSNAEITRTHPAATLQPDAFDAPAATAVSEAAKAGGSPDAPPPADPHSGHHHGNSPKEP
jgi:hypothetical protein